MICKNSLTRLRQPNCFSAAREATKSIGPDRYTRAPWSRPFFVLEGIFSDRVAADVRRRSADGWSSSASLPRRLLVGDLWGARISRKPLRRWPRTLLTFPGGLF